MALVEFVKPSEAKYRLEICKGNKEYYPCDSYFKLTGTKVYKRGNHIERCPLNKW